MRQRTRVGVCLAVAAMGLAACSSKVEIPESALLSCATATDCPSGRICHQGLCVSPGGIDTTPPDLASAPTVSPAAGRAGVTFTIDVAPSEPLVRPPEVTLALVPPAAAPCVAQGGGYRCSYTASGSENGGLGGVVPFDVRLVDRQGNETLRKLAGAVNMDFTAPHVAGPANVAYYPAPSNPLPAVMRANAGTVVRVTVGADELLATSPSAAPTLVARGPLGATLALEFSGFVPNAASPTGATFEGTVPASAPDGSYAWTVEWSDVVGNAGSTAGTPAVEVKTSAPTLTVNQDALVLVRSPWGNAAPEDLGGYTIPAGPYFALEPSDALTSTPTLPPSSLLLDGGAVPASLIVQSAADPTALVLGVLRPDAAGHFAREPLVTPDLTGVWLVGVDDAGNRSAPVALRNAEWVATPNPPAIGTSPHLLLATGYASPSRDQGLAPVAVVRADATGTDGAAALARSAVAWRGPWGGLLPAARWVHAMAYDSARGRLVLFGGNDGTSFGSNLQDTWEWDGSSWTQAATGGPDARVGHAMVYDSARGRVVLFGGRTNVAPFYVDDTWEWDGASWTQVASGGPSGRYLHAMVYDSARGRVVLFGGETRGPGTQLQDTWEWDGSTWTPVASGGPSARAGHAMAYDSARGRVVLFGGAALADYGDTWEWDGSSWAPMASGGPERIEHAMAYDGARGRVVMFGGSDHSQDTWEWDGASWTRVATGGPSGREDLAMAYDGARGRVVLFGGRDINATVQRDTWEWDGAGWTEAGRSQPSSRAGAAMVYDGARARAVLFGGFTTYFQQDTWEWNGSAWTRVAGDGPALLASHAMAYDGARRRVVLFGGRSPIGYGQATWEWDGATWTTVATAGPSGRENHAMAYDAARGRVVLFGGDNDSSVLGDTWEWDGSSWAEKVTTGGPSARYGNALAYDAARRRVVLFGGSSSTGVTQDTWEWDGASWAQVASSGPPARTLHAMAYDGVRGRVVLFGGVNDTSVLGDTWEWNGSSWSQVATSGPSARCWHAMAHDSVRSRVVLFGGGGGNGPLPFPETWELDAAAGRRAAMQFEASSATLGTDPSRITGLRVRAFAGGSFAPGGAGDVGATLLGWASRGPLNEPGAWVSLAANGTGVAGTTPYLPPGAASLVSWQSASAAEARRYLVDPYGFTFQLRPRGGAGAASDGAAAALDYVEVRVRYQNP